MHSQRVSIVEQWNQFFHEDLKYCYLILRLNWNTIQVFILSKVCLHDLGSAASKDMDRRYTEYGPHRADLRLKTPLAMRMMYSLVGKKVVNHGIKTVTNCNAACE